MRLCFDAGPTENGHRERGIGWCTYHLLHALTPELLSKHGASLHYLRRTPFAEQTTTGRFRRRSRVVDWIGEGGRLPDRLTVRWKAFAGPVGLASDIRSTGAEVFLGTDPLAVPLSRAFRTVAILYDLIPLRFAREYLPRHAFLRQANYAYQLRRLRRADHLIAISEATRRDAIELLDIGPSRISVVHLAVDSARFQPIDPEEARRAVAERFGIDRPYFLYVGAMEPHKNLGAVVQAFSRVFDSTDAVLVVAGGSGPGSRRLWQQLRGTAAGERVLRIGYVPGEDLPALYAGSLAFLFPSLYEGFGLPVLEAMSCGAPVLTSPLSSLPEVAGDAALYADPSSPLDLTAALHRLTTEPALRAELSARGLERARRFSWTDTAERILETCRAVHEGRLAQ